MKTTQALFYALRLSYGQIASDLNGPVRQISTKRDHSTTSAAILAFIGLGVSGFSLKQLASKSSRKFK
ncbi:CLUMA_CG001266, isoform A [Clunio marinus]|uniref:CLUMA_CG001266, isoform A n=1 Tax=Clunio marinus TaxID=568069 RepID=A0A1J1HMK3_9DIPT|nr:CLUMA_CG001266, isoform A [Clunio marinus]